MKTIQQKYFQICNGLYKPMGFIRVGRTYLRLLNDVIQCFTFERISFGRSCRVWYGVVPLSMGIDSHIPEGGYLLHDLTPEFYWENDLHNESSVDAVLGCIIPLISEEIISLFDEADCCKTALPSLLQHDKRVFENMRQEYKQQRDSWEIEGMERATVTDTKYYMALKIGDIDYAIQHYEAKLRLRNKLIEREEANQMNDPDHDYSGRIDLYLKQRLQIEVVLSSLCQKDLSWVKMLVQQNEKKTKNHFINNYPRCVKNAQERGDINWLW